MRNGLRDRVRDRKRCPAQRQGLPVTDTAETGEIKQGTEGALASIRVVANQLWCFAMVRSYNPMSRVSLGPCQVAPKAWRVGDGDT